MDKNTDRKSDKRKIGKSPLIQPCKLCEDATHSNLFGCPNFKKYLPGQPNGSKSLPKEV